MKEQEQLEIVNPGEVEIPEDYMNELSDKLQKDVENELLLRKEILKN